MELKFDSRLREIQTREIRNGNEMLFQGRTIIHNLDGTIEEPEWFTTGSIINYGDVYDYKPSLLDRFMGLFK